MITSQVLFLAAGITLAVSPSHAVSLFGITLICAGFAGFGVAMSQALGPFSLRAGRSPTLRYCAGLRFVTVDLAGSGGWYRRMEYADRDSDCRLTASCLLIMFVAP